MTMESETQGETLDVLVIGAGLSGIGMACHLASSCPDQSFAILERRQDVGGTWDLFRYPGIRSDSDMFTFGFQFRPWTDPKVLADGTSIRNYIRDTAQHYKVYDEIRFGVKLTRADWSSRDNSWTLTALHEASGETRHYRCRFLVMCTGYYNYDAGYTPEFAGREDFRGQIIHPQKWPENLDYSGKRVVVIGSGATAVTLVPAMADKAAHVTMLQRSPSYVFSLPAIDKISIWMKRFMPESWVFRITRWRNIVLQRLLFKASKRWPQTMRNFFVSSARKHLGEDFDMRHFSPNYDPWDQRLCAVPDADLFDALRDGRASVVTDHIDRFVESGIRLKSGDTLDADIIVTATGLDLQLMGGMQVFIDGETRPTNQLMSYKAVMVQDVPNMALIYGYTNATWTLKADIAARYICRLLNHMTAKGYDTATPRDNNDSAVGDASVLDALNAGYVQRASDRLPRQGKALPWRVLNDYRRDKTMLLDQAIEDGVLEFTSASSQRSSHPARHAA